MRVKKNLVLLFLVFLVAVNSQGQKLDIQVKFSEPLAVLDFVDHLSANAPDNPYKKAFQSSGFNREKYTGLIAEYEKLTIDYDYEYPEYPPQQKIGGSTKSLLKKNLINSASINDFRLNSLGLIPNRTLFRLSEILTEFDPVYQETIYRPNREKFEKQLADIKNLIASPDMSSYFNVGIKFYDSSWDNSIPFNFVFYPIPLPGSKGFTATAFYNYAVSAVPTGLTDYNVVLGVMFHEIFHILFDEQTPEMKNNIEKWFASNPSPNSRYAYGLMNEALATSLGNGYVYGKLNGRENEGNWYGRKYVSLMAKKIYPIVTEYISAQKPMDKAFVDNYVKLYDDNFSEWKFELDYLTTGRTVLTDNAADFDVIDRKFPYRSGQEYTTNINKDTLEKTSKTLGTKIIIVSKDNKNKLHLVKQTFPELKNWKPNDKVDFTYPVFLADKSFLLIINSIKNSTEKQLESLQEELNKLIKQSAKSN